MEENKVREKLALVIHARRCGCGRICDPSNAAIADAILQSPDLRVTIVEPRFRAEGVTVRDSKTNGDYVIGGFATADLAQEYADFKNSKEPK